jgi:uncharacterized protein YdcH (DUF465 family)
MQTEHQDLKKEFPQLAAHMDVLQQSNVHFAKALDEFNALTAEIEHIERNDATAGESVLEQMKKRRLALKERDLSDGIGLSRKTATRRDGTAQHTRPAACGAGTGRRPGE